MASRAIFVGGGASSARAFRGIAIAAAASVSADAADSAFRRQIRFGVVLMDGCGNRGHTPAEWCCTGGGTRNAEASIIQVDATMLRRVV